MRMFVLRQKVKRTNLIYYQFNNYLLPILMIEIKC